MANGQSFVHLHFHTAYSLLDGACRIDSTMERTRELGMSAVAMTDHGVLFGVVDFYKQARAAGIKPIIGCEVYVAPGSRLERDQNSGTNYHHLVLLAETIEGYANLSKLVSLGYLEGYYYKPRIDKELLSQHHRGLIGLAACLKGEVAESCAREMVDKAALAAGVYQDILGKGNFFLEIQDHGLQEQRIANRGILDISRRLDIPVVATNDVHYLRAEHARAHEVMLCLQTQSTISDPDRMRYASDQFYMKSGEEMAQLFPDNRGALDITLEIAERCNVELNVDGRELHFPVFDVPDGVSQKEELLRLGREGLRSRYGIEDADNPKTDEERHVCERLFYEMSIIEKTGFINYFLVVSDFIRFARRENIPVGPGRGSGAGSLVAYVLGITGIDPLRYGLIFERFLNPERVSPPDFDIDFCQHGRARVIEYVKDKYGRENVAQIVTFGSLGAKTVIRDVGRVLEIPFNECDRLAKMVPDDVDMTLEKALDQNPELRHAVEREENAARIMEYARVLEGLYRNIGTHAAGVVIGDKPLLEMIPLARDKDGQPVTQFEMKPLESTGLLKMDFLGLKTLTTIKEAVDNIRFSSGEELDVEQLPLDDEETYALLNRGDTIGVFQVESRGMRDLLRRIGLTRIEDLIAMIALFRPGPMKMLDDYVERKHGKVPIGYDHPLLEPILEETYGVMLYQEQVQHAARALAGFSLGQGDILRRAMGKKNKDQMASMKEKFIEGCRSTNNIPAAQAERLFENIESFAGYGFNKSHSAAYAVIAYQTAYLKTHYPVAFMAALLSIEMGNADKLPVLIAEAQEMGIQVLPPDVNESGVRFTPVGENIRFGLAGVKNVGSAAVEAVVAERTANGRFTGLIDFCSRMDARFVNRKILESLVKAGAFDFCDYTRARMFAAIEFAIGRAQGNQRDRLSGQTTLFSMMTNENNAADDDELPPSAGWSMQERLSYEKELLGFYISGHPLKEYEWILQSLSLHRIAELPQLTDSIHTRVGGLVSRVSRTITKRAQRPMANFRLEGLEAAVDALALPDTYEKYGHLLQDEQPVMVCGTLKNSDELKFFIEEVYPLQDAPLHFAARLDLHLTAATVSDDFMNRIRQKLRDNPGPTPAAICLQLPAGEKVVIDTGPGYKVTVGRQLIGDLRQLVGENNVYLAKLTRPGKSAGGKRRRGHNGKPRNGDS